MMIGINEVTITPEECPVCNISSDQQFSVQTGDFVGVYNNDALLVDSANSTTTGFRYVNNQSGTVGLMGRSGVDNNIAIKVLVGKYNYIYIMVNCYCKNTFILSPVYSFQYPSPSQYYHY